MSANEKLAALEKVLAYVEDARDSFPRACGDGRELGDLQCLVEQMVDEEKARLERELEAQAIEEAAKCSQK